MITLNEFSSNTPTAASLSRLGPSGSKTIHTKDIIKLPQISGSKRLKDRGQATHHHLLVIKITIEYSDHTHLI